MVGRAIRLSALLVLLQVPGPAAAGDCMAKAEGFQLASDTVHWTFAIPAGWECLQGLRGRSMLIDEVKVLEPPSAGSLTISGPSFVYKAPKMESVDRFKIRISGENHRMRGTSEVEVNISIRQ